MRKAILSQRIAWAEGYDEVRDALSHDWTLFLERHGYIPFPVPNRLGLLSEYVNTVQPDLIILTGGNSAADEQPDVAVRNVQERKLMQIAIDQQIPLLGVCRGMQWMNRMLGGSIERISNAASNHVNQFHIIRVLPSPILSDETTATVNSFHEDGFKLNDLAPALTPFALSADDYVEGYYHEQHRIAGVQWHPERKQLDPRLDQAIIEYLQGKVPTT